MRAKSRRARRRSRELGRKFLGRELHVRGQVHRVQPAWKKNALIDNETYLKWYADSVKNPDKFWGKHGKRIDWFKPYKKVKNTSFTGKVVDQMVRGRRAQRLLQLHRPAPEEARRPDGDHLGRRQPL